MLVRVEAHRNAPEPDERGDTLIELLIALVIIALAVVPVLGLTFEMLSGSAEHRSLATLNNIMKSFAETATSQIELTPTSTGFNNCAGTVSYKLLSVPTPRVAAPGAAVTIFTTGFDSGIPLRTFTVTVGGKLATKTTKSSQNVSGSEMGNMQLTFFVPASLSGSKKIVVSDGVPDQTVTSTSQTNLTVAPTGITSEVSTLAGYTLGVRLIRYWNPGTTRESAALTDCYLDGGAQLLTVHGRSGGGVSDTLTFDLRNPARKHVSVAAPTVAVTATPALAALPSSGTSHLVFSAVVTTPTTYARPSQPLTWSITEPTGAVACPSEAGPTPGGENSSDYSCTITLSPSSATGRYLATATYRAVDTVPATSTAFWAAVGTIYGKNGGGIASVSPASATAQTSGTTFTFKYTVPPGGMSSGELVITVPTSPTSTMKWTKPQSSNPAAAGYTAAAAGTTSLTVITTGNEIEVTSLTLSGGTKLTITYGDGGGASGVKTPTTGTYKFAVEQRSIPGGSLTPVSGTPLTVTVDRP